MNLTGREYKEAQRHINNWEKFAKQWSKFRWIALCVLLLNIIAAVMGYRAFWKMNEYNTHSILLGDGVIPEIGIYIDNRMDLLRAEIKYYIGFLISGVTASIFFVAVFLGWNRHEYISAKVKIFKKLLEKKE